MSTKWVFDETHYKEMNVARAETASAILTTLKTTLGLESALDLGCGLGYYSSLLHDSGFRVLGLDGRKENVEEAGRRFPHIEFQVADAEDPSLHRFGSFDLVFCFGLVYHLENPFRVIRNIAKMATKAALVEGMVYPSLEPVMVLLDENEGVDQGLNHMAFYASEACLVKMLRRSGFPSCYLPDKMPAHPDFHAGRDGFPRRTMLLSSKSPLSLSGISSWPLPSAQFGPSSMVPLYPARGVHSRLYAPIDKLLYGRARNADRA